MVGGRAVRVVVSDRKDGVFKSACAFETPLLFGDGPDEVGFDVADRFVESRLVGFGEDVDLAGEAVTPGVHPGVSFAGFGAGAGFGSGGGLFDCIDLGFPFRLDSSPPEISFRLVGLFPERIRTLRWKQNSNSKPKGKTRMKRLLILLPLTVAILAPSYAASITLDSPGGEVSGQPGTTVGWGFTLQGDSSDWLVVTAVSLGTDPFPVGSAANFTDLLSSWAGDNNYAVDPGASLTQAYSGGLGLAEFNIPGANNPGDTSGTLTINVDYDLYTGGNPFVDGSASYDRSSEISAAAQIDVVASSSSPTAPEPGTWVMLIAALAMIAVGRSVKVRS